MRGRLDGKTALISGGIRGISYAVAQAFAAEGCRLVLDARDAGDGRSCRGFGPYRYSRGQCRLPHPVALRRLPLWGFQGRHREARW